MALNIILIWLKLPFFPVAYRVQDNLGYPTFLVLKFLCNFFLLCVGWGGGGWDLLLTNKICKSD